MNLLQTAIITSMTTTLTKNGHSVRVIDNIVKIDGISYIVTDKGKILHYGEEISMGQLIKDVTVRKLTTA